MLVGRQKVIHPSETRTLCVPVHRGEIDQEVVAKIVAQCNAELNEFVSGTVHRRMVGRLAFRQIIKTLFQ